jgi:hypothetical protein
MGSHADDDSEDDMDGFFDSEERSPDAENEDNDSSTGDCTQTRTSNNVDDVNGVNFSLHPHFAYRFCCEPPWLILLIADSHSGSVPGNDQLVRTSLTRIRPTRVPHKRR